MQFSVYNPADADAIEQLFTRTFTASEGPSEGAIVGGLAGALMRSTELADGYGFVACDDAQIVASIFFSRMWFGSEINAFLLAPVATLTSHQRRGIGQRLIRFGLETLQADGVELVVTYGDPRFYSKVGFRQVTAAQVPPPCVLSLPEGWMAQSLVGDAIAPVTGPSRCVEVLNRPEFW